MPWTSPVPQSLPSHRFGKRSSSGKLSGASLWLSLTTAAVVTDSIRLGSMITPLPRVRLWDLASKGAPLTDSAVARVQLAAGSAQLTRAGRPSMRPRTPGLGRNEDEGLAIYAGSWRDNPSLTRERNTPPPQPGSCSPRPPVQHLFPPVWVLGAAHVGVACQPSVERAARWQGWLPQVVHGDRRTDPVAGGALQPDRPRGRCARTQDCPENSSTSA
jgi:alkanesulfonate monooxygenase SsuD/methylene tetrahydromethanopterin reductase-like flavin-dependent oxidoreductase (luciferase family)